MAVTKVSDVQAQVQEFWSPLFMDELRIQLILGSLVNKDYSGELKKKGDTVKVSQITKAAGQLRTVGVDSEVFTSEALTTTQVEVKADRRAVASFELEDLIEVQSQLGDQDSAIREALMQGVAEQIDTHLKTFIAPTALQDRAGVTDFNATELALSRKQACTSLWNRKKPWWGLFDCEYYADLIENQTLTSADFVDDRPTVSGQIVNQRYGFNILEDNSLASENALLFHPDFLYMVMQTEPRFKVSDLHSNKQFAFLISVDLVFGAALGLEGAQKHIRVINT